MTDNNFIKQQDSLQYTLGIVYEPHVPDTDGEFMDGKEIRKCAWEFVERLQDRSVNKKVLTVIDAITKAHRHDAIVKIDVTELFEKAEEIKKNLGIEHREWGHHLGTITDSFVTPEKITIAGEEIEKDTWLMGVRWSEEQYKKILDGEINGYSMGGKGKRVPVEI